MPALTTGPHDASEAKARGLRVDMHKLDRMLDLTGEIAIARNRLRRMIEEGGARPDLLEAQGEVDRLCQDLQERVMQARLVPLRATLRQHIRTVRDLSASQGKQARLVLEGEDVEVDTSVIEHVRDPLTHMIRNAIDHGIEHPGPAPPARQGSLRDHRASRAPRVGDDRPRDLRRRRRPRPGAHPRPGPTSAVSTPRAWMRPRSSVWCSSPGFSTAETVTELSGRGVGLDVVRRNIHALRGSVGIRSRAGEGTTISVRLPLTLAIIEGFGVAVGDETYVIPLEAVVECLELPAEVSSDGDGARRDQPARRGPALRAPAPAVRSRRRRAPRARRGRETGRRRAARAWSSTTSTARARP